MGFGDCCDGGKEDGDEETENFGDEMILGSGRGQTGANDSDKTDVATDSVLMNLDSDLQRNRFRKAVVVSGLDFQVHAGINKTKMTSQSNNEGYEEICNKNYYIMHKFSIFKIS